jgi:hypothetical protein
VFSGPQILLIRVVSIRDEIFGRIPADLKVQNPGDRRPGRGWFASEIWLGLVGIQIFAENIFGHHHIITLADQPVSDDKFVGCQKRIIKICHSEDRRRIALCRF